MTTPPNYPVDPTGPLTIGTIPDADLDRLVAATVKIEPPAGTEASDWQYDEHGTVLSGTSAAFEARGRRLSKSRAS